MKQVYRIIKSIGKCFIKMIQNKGECNRMDNLEKNTYVKKEITKALLSLLQKKDLNDITIRELTLDAGVGRVSFYRNYKTKEEILEQYIEMLILKWSKEEIQENQPTNKLIKKLFEHMIDHKDIYTLLYQKNLLYIFRKSLQKIMIKNQELSNIEAYAVAFLSYGLYGWIEEWLARGLQESADEIYAILQAQFFMKGS